MGNFNDREWGFSLIANTSGDLGFLPINWSQFLIRTSLAAGTHYVKVKGAPGDHGPYALYVEEVVEPGDSAGEATALSVGKAAGGHIDPSTDADYFRIDVAQGGLVMIRAVSESAKTVGFLLDDQENSLGRYDTETLPGGSFGFVIYAVRQGTYYLKVTGSGDTTGSYALLALDRTFEHTPNNQFRTGCKAIATAFDDPLYGCQWNLNNTGQLEGTAGEDANVEEVWDDYLGSGVNVAVVDDRMFYDHEDLTANVDRSRSYDYVTDDGYFSLLYSHSTMVAGVIAARDNGMGVRGVAPRATIYGYNYLRDPTTATRFDAMTRHLSTTAISNNSWGLGDGPGLFGIDRFWELGVDQGVTRGYGGKGIFYVWAAGNGGSKDYANHDELANYYGVTAVCAVNDQGVRSAFSEKGANLWICAPSNDSARHRSAITTTSPLFTYTDHFGGTSAAAPVVSGVAALLREANPDLTWRDLKLILAASARKNDSTNTGWETGAVRYGSDTDTYWFNHEYGFGVVDAGAAVGLVDDWDLVPPMIRTDPVSASPEATIADLGSTDSTITVGSELEFIEFVEVNIRMDAPSFRSLEITLESPSNAVSTLSGPLTATQFTRYNHGGRLRLKGSFRFGSARHLGENPAGDWTLTVTDTLSGHETADLESWSLTFYGHRETPAAPGIESVDQASGALTVRWTAPGYVGASSVTSYDVRYLMGEGAWTVRDSAWTSGSLQYTISGLTDGDSYGVQVRAVNDAGDGAWSETKTGTVGASNGPPAFTEGSSTTRTVRENWPQGIRVGSPVRATDTDGDTLTYSLSGPASHLFTIDTSTGQILVNRENAFNYETRPTIRVTVSVHDGKNPTGAASDAIDDTIKVIITVSDVNEPPRISGGKQNNATREGSVDVSTYAAADPEQAQLVWSLTGEDSGDFTINRIGRLRFREVPDFEAPADADRNNVYVLTVGVSDGSLSDTIGIKVTVANVQEPPEITGPTSIAYDEHGTARVAVYEADDPEDDPVEWALRGTDASAFTVSDSGGLSFLQPPDHEAPTDRNGDKVYQVTVNASDGRYNSARNVVVTVGNVEEPGMVTLSSDQPQVDTPFEARLTDPDGSLSNAVWKWERSTTGSGWSTIGGSTSNSHTPTETDLGHYLRVTVSYTDGYNSSTKTLQATSAMQVRAAPPVNSPPQFPTTETGSRSVPENSPPGQDVGDPVTATDDNGDSLVYSLGGVDASLFGLDSLTGQLSTTRSFDYEDASQPGSYQVTVTATDPTNDRTASL